MISFIDVAWVGRFWLAGGVGRQPSVPPIPRLLPLQDAPPRRPAAPRGRRALLRLRPCGLRRRRPAVARTRPHGLGRALFRYGTQQRPSHPLQVGLASPPLGENHQLPSIARRTSNCRVRESASVTAGVGYTLLCHYSDADAWAA